MNNRQNEVEMSLSSVTQEPSSTSHKTEKGVDAAQNGLFAGMFGSFSSEKAANFVMTQEGNFVFTTALFFRLAKLGIATYNFFSNKNKNLSESAEYAWTMITGLALAAVIAGSIFAAPLFVLAAPIVFVSVFGLDTLRNIFLTLWNLGRWGMLAYQTRGDKDPLTKLKYKKLRSIYKWNAIGHGFSSAIGLIGTAATVVIFLLPHVGLAAFAGIAVVKGLAIASGSSFLIGTAVSIFGSMVMPYVAAGWKKIKSFLGFSKKIVPQADERQPLLAAQREQARLLAKPKFRINTMDEFKVASAHRIDHKLFMNRSKHRELLVENINPQKPELALEVLKEMVKHKVDKLSQQWFKTSWLDNRQEYKRRMKLEALGKVQEYLDGKEVRNDENLKIDNVDALIKYIDRKYPEVDQSFFRNESDTRNILKAVKAYEKFEKVEVEVSNRRGMVA